MPAAFYAVRDTRQPSSGGDTYWRRPTYLDSREERVLVRRCPTCRRIFEATGQYFWQSPSTGRLGYCRQGCHQAYNARRRSRRPAAPRGRRTGRRFGVEIEFIGSRREVVEALRAAGIECAVPTRTHRRSRTWTVVRDGSVCNGGELVSPVLQGEAGLRQIESVCAVLASIGITVDRSCGLHVHHDVRDLDIASFRRLFINWSASQAAIDTLVAPSRRERRDNCANWCRRLTAAELNVITSLRDMAAARTINISRYRALNVMAYPRHGTVEVRQHQGTVTARKICAWVRFGQALFKYSAETASPLACRNTQSTSRPPPGARRPRC